MNPIKVGVIGYGYWGPNLTRNFIEIQNSDVVIAADLNRDRLTHLKHTYPQIEVTENYLDLFDKGLEAVVVATPPHTHYAVTRDCLEHGLHVLVEKPLTVNSGHAQELIELAEKKGLVLMVGHTFEYNAAVHALKKLMDDGGLGQIYYLDAARLNLGLYQKNLNVIWDLAPHDISIMNYIMGCPPVMVSARGSANVNRKVEDVAYINLVFPGDVMAHIHVSWLDPCKVRRVTVVGSKKMAVYNDIESLEKIKIYDKGVEAPAYTDSFEDFHYSYRYGDVLIPNIPFKEPLRLECQHYLDCIANHVQPVTNGQDGLNVIKVIEAAQVSLQNNGREEKIAW